MSFPDIIFKHTNVTESNDIDSLIEQKLSLLERYIGNETDVKCEVEFEKIAPHNSGDVHRVEVNFWLAGKMHRAEATEATFEAAIDVVKDELDRELNKEHDKHQTLVRKGGREIKEAIRFGGEE